MKHVVRKCAAVVLALTMAFAPALCGAEAGNQTVWVGEMEIALPFREGLALVKQNGKVGFIDKAGNMVVEPQWDVAYSFSDGLAAVALRGKWGYIDQTGNVVIQPEWSSHLV